MKNALLIILFKMMLILTQKDYNVPCIAHNVHKFMAPQKCRSIISSQFVYNLKKVYLLMHYLSIIKPKLQSKKHKCKRTDSKQKIKRVKYTKVKKIFKSLT